MSLPWHNEAKRYYAAGVPLAVIAAHFGRPKSTVWAAISDENKRRRAAKTRWERDPQNKPKCPLCGEPMGHRQGTKRCVRCRTAQARRREDHILALLREGYLAREIAEQLGTTPVAISSVAWRLRKGGVSVPRSPTGAPAHRRVAA